MSYPEFREEIFKALQGMISKDITIELLEVEKLNSCIRHGISFTKEGEMYSPTIYLEPFYGNFRKGRSIDFLAEELLRCYREETGQVPDCIRRLDSYMTARQDIYVKLVHIAENRNLLKDTPHKVFLDFALVPYFEVNNEQIYKGSVLLKEHHLEFWQVSAEEVLSYAIEHTRREKGVWFRPMADVLEDIIFEEDGEIYERAKEGMFVLTNNEKYLGAVLAYFPDILYDIGKCLKEDFYMLPASVHEWVIVPKTQVMEEETLFSMVKDINDSEVIEEEVLSYNVYFYSIDSQKIHICKSIKVKNH